MDASDRPVTLALIFLPKDYLSDRREADRGVVFCFALTPRGEIIHLAFKREKFT